MLTHWTRTTNIIHPWVFIVKLLTKENFDNKKLNQNVSWVSVPKDLRTFLRTLLLCVVTSLGWDIGIFGICTFHIIPFEVPRNIGTHRMLAGVWDIDETFSEASDGCSLPSDTISSFVRNLYVLLDSRKRLNEQVVFWHGTWCQILTKTYMVAFYDILIPHWYMMNELSYLWYKKKVFKCQTILMSEVNCKP